ncbi:hypothetical protein PBY51_014694 [Eleginops maclovinus]|uniref:Uncharacterized protein n=1 Tax=Eleginops maclovinus TaxID=56733 RepID=A0AAN7X2X2_ELEMC|nr:hypothetical protein PBY51_014694 [Eleginops maclovinus]
MASSGPPALEHLLTRVTRWFTGFAGGSLWPVTNLRPDAATPAEDLFLPDYEDMVGADEADAADGLQEAQDEPQGGDGDSEQPPPAAPSPVYYPVPYAVPYAVLYAVPYSVPYAVPYPYYAPWSNPYAYPYASPFADPHAYPQAAPAYPQAPPAYNDPPYDAYPSDDDNNHAREELFRRYFDEPLAEDEDEEIDVVGLDFPVLDVEDIGPISLEDSSEVSIDSSTKRCREDSEEEEESPAKRPRWSEDSDSD